MAVEDYSTTPASNVAIEGINIAEGCLPGDINDALRQLMADLKAYAATVLPKSGGDVTGPLSATALTSVQGSVTSQSSGTENANYWIRDETGKSLGVLYADPAGSFVRLRKYAADGSTDAELSLTENDVALAGIPATASSGASIMTRARADARFSPLGHTHDDRYAPASHDHDGRYYTKEQGNGRYVSNGGDTIDGSLSVTGETTVQGGRVVHSSRTTSQVGCIVFAKSASADVKQFGDTISGSNLLPSDSSGIGEGIPLSGTWLSWGRCAPNNAGLFVRIL